MILIDDLNNGKMPVVVAPLAGYHDPPQAAILSMLGVRHMIYPFISAEGMLRRKKYRDEVTEKLVVWKKIMPEGGSHYQIFGREPVFMSECAVYLKEVCGADAVNLNMGCSVKKVWKAESGSWLLKSPDLALRIIEAVVKSVNIPVTLKTRTGWDHSDLNGLEVIRKSPGLGITAVMLHPRFGKEKYKDQARWEYIRQITGEIKIPVIGNGDITSPQDASRMIQLTGCQGIMIGRASIGNPWIFNQCELYIHTGKEKEEPSAPERIEVCLKHIEELVKFKGVDAGVRESRKHVARYLKGLRGAAQVRQEIMLMNGIDEVRVILINFMNELHKENS